MEASAEVPFHAGHVCLVMLSTLGDVVHAMPVAMAIQRHVSDTPGEPYGLQPVTAGGSSAGAGIPTRAAA